MKFCSLISVLNAVLFAVSGSIYADDLNPPPYRGFPASVFFEFDFNDKGMNPSPPTQGNWVPGPNGEPLDNVAQPCVEFDPAFVFLDGSWFNQFIKPGVFRIKAPNIIDDFPIKHIRLQITWSFNGPSNPPEIFSVTGVDEEDGPLTDVTFLGGSTMMMGAMRHTTYNIRVRPNPDRELIELFAQPGMLIKQVVIDTISVPGVILGDVNGDGVANLLDVTPFVMAIANGVYSPEADINEDGTVNLLDVVGFVEILSGG